MSASDIVSVHGRRVWDSRGKPTVEAEVTLAGGARGRAIAPAGASTGSGEAVDLRDGGSRFGGADVMNAVANVNGEIAKALAGRDARDQAGIDAALIALDGTPNKARLGANATVATSMAVLHAAAAAAGVPLYAYLLGDRPAVMPTPGDSDFRRRRACRAARRHPGFHGGGAEGAKVSRRRWTGPPRSIARPAP